MMSLQTAPAATALSAYPGYLATMLRLFRRRHWLLAAAGTLAAALLIALPAALIENPVFGRQIEARLQDYLFLAATAPIGGLIIASYAFCADGGSEGKATAGGFLSFLAVGCPVCNKAAVLALGSSGALSIFGPAQLFIGFASLALLGWVLFLRARAIAGACPLPR